MERYSDRAIEIINELHRERLDYQSEYLPLIDAANKLSAYEDTGLEPEQVMQTIDPESLRPVSRLMQDKYGGIKCENCGYCVSVGGKNAYHNAKKAYQFCPHCGARMED